MNEKTCTPANCPHAALLKRARAACIACTCGGKPAGHGGQVSIEAAGEAIVRSNSAYIDRSPRGQVTKLGQRTEDMAAELFRRWQGLDTIDSLLALHLANGGTCANFGAYLERTHAAIDKLRPERKAFRATAWSKWQGILKRLPLLRGVQSWSKGHGGAKPGQGKGREHKFADAGREELRQQRKAARQQADETKAQQQAARLAQRIQRQNQHWLEMLQRRGAATAARLAKFERRRREAASGVQPSAPAGPTTAPAQPTAAEVSS